MKIEIKNPRQNPVALIRKCGYIPWYDFRFKKASFIRRLTRAYYPRFHLNYFYNKEGSLILDLHLDARRPMHKKGIRTSEDEESEVVKKEGERIKRILGQE